MLRIAVVMGKYTPGGIKSVIMNYYRAIDKKRYQFDVFVYDDSPDKDYSEIEALGGHVYLVSNIKRPYEFIKDLRDLFKKNSYKIVHGYLNTLNVFVMLAAKLAGVPVRIAENLSTAHAGEKKTIIKNALKPWARCFSTNIAANSKFAAEWLYGDEARDALIIRNALDLDKYKFNNESRSTMRAKYNIENKYVIGHIGRFSYQKNHDFLIDIFNEINKKIDDAVLMLIGYGELFDDIKSKVIKLGLVNKVIFVGKTEALSDYYNAMDCFVLPSFYEGLPVVGIEAQAFGLPCVLSSEVTEETKILNTCKFVSLKLSASEWADEVIHQRDEERLTNNMALKAAGYDLKTEAESLMCYYDDLLKMRS